MYERAFRGLREGQPDAKEEAVMLLEAWRAFEQGCTSRWVAQGAGAARLGLAARSHCRGGEAVGAVA